MTAADDPQLHRLLAWADDVAGDHPTAPRSNASAQPTPYFATPGRSLQPAPAGAAQDDVQHDPDRQRCRRPPARDGGAPQTEAQHERASYEREGCVVRRAPFAIVIGPCAVVGDPFGSAVYILDMSKGPRDEQRDVISTG